ncbi:protein of unknown function [Candidatus Nitrotoga arctica]|uniref:Transposase DDE domain-containing protein n=1 Tax=Candidatus Nitrotoga arctica TaxID=453162 RepID=A0ABN8AH82_9PROT|nr:transposase [Candidatus Nitrotoga arctica]CAG9932085.1 protein of unknown function [Candidatus Nitrotoga arctica]
MCAIETEHGRRWNESKIKAITGSDTISARFMRQVSFLQGKRDEQENHVERMKVKIDTDTGREMITRRFATVEPVFGNLRGNKRLHRFTLRGKTKVDGQWKLYCMMHNIEKLANYGYAR